MDKKEPVIKYASYGRPYITTAEIYEDGTVEVKRWRPSVVLIEHDSLTKRITDEELESLLGTFEENDFFGMKNKYNAYVESDGSPESITYNYRGKKKTVKTVGVSGESAPEGFDNIRREIQKLLGN